MADIVVLRLATVAQVGSAIICYNIAIYEFVRLESPWLKIVAKIENYSRATQHSHGYRPLFNCSFLSNTKHLLSGVILCHAVCFEFFCTLDDQSHYLVAYFRSGSLYPCPRRSGGIDGGVP